MAAEFSLNTQMFLLSKKTLWLSDGSMGFGQESDVAFSEGIIVHRSCIFNVFHTVRFLLQSKQDRSKGLGLLLVFFCICLSYLGVYVRAVGQSALKLLRLRITVLVPFLIS